jgi:hypothetical protein
MTVAETAPTSAGAGHGSGLSRFGRAVANRIGYGNAYALGVYLATRVAVTLGVTAAYLMRPAWSWRHIVTRDDAWWYERIAAHGYGHTLRLHLPGDLFHSHYSPWAFYPGYPLAVRLAHEVTRLPYSTAGFVLSFVLAGAAVRAVYELGDACGGQVVARGSAALVAAWPGSAAMNLPYSEGLFMTAAAFSLAALLRRRWWLAGVLGAVATLTRAVGLALVAAAIVAAVSEIRGRREWRALVAPLLTGAGAAAFYLYGWWQTGDPLVWRHAEGLWRQKLDFGAEVVHRLLHDFSLRGTASGGAIAVSTLLLTVGLAMLALMLAAAVGVRRDLRLPLLVYGVVSTALVVGYSNVGPRPRMILAIIPGFVWLAKWLPPRLVEVLVMGLASALALTAFLYVSIVIP